jgi:hypothetical protein
MSHSFPCHPPTHSLTHSLTNQSYHKRRAFIATQGPLTSTVEDFWRMLWQYSVPVVVMLTEEVEKGRVSCGLCCSLGVCSVTCFTLISQECSAGYWPGAILHPISYGKLTVELNVERNSGSYSYRDLCVTNTKVRGATRGYRDSLESGRSMREVWFNGEGCG